MATSIWSVWLGWFIVTVTMAFVSLFTNDLQSIPWLRDILITIVHG